MHEDKEHDADVCIDNTEEHGDSVDHLIEKDAPLGGRVYFGGYLVFEEPCTLCIPPTGEEDTPKQEQIQPVHAHGDAIGDDFS